MKNLLLLGTFVASLNLVFAEDGLYDPSRNFKVLSDSRDPGIKRGTFIIQGIVKMSPDNSPLRDVQVGMIENAAHTKTDSLGFFRITCNTATDSTLYFYKEKWSEITVDCDFKDQHRITISIALEKDYTNAVKRKPVIYCYSEQPLTASVKLDPKGVFTFTYPNYNTGWQFTVNPSGGITDLASGKDYPYLFWEAESENLFYQVAENTIPGFIIHTDSTIQFLEEKLTALGLNQTEQADFITFWGPILQKQPYALIQFLVDDVYESEIASLDISPTPDAMRRVYILYSPLEDMHAEMPVVAQHFNSFERFGFTVVEWGGSNIDLTRLKP